MLNESIEKATKEGEEEEEKEGGKKTCNQMFEINLI